ncbi:MAG: recombinase family protein [Clostridia bacterium]|nr:recombinase family protein [Clostridia bacterium]
MKAVIYARYSSDNQREESIEGQLRECKEYAEKNGMTILNTYIDRALSAKTDNRPEFQHMIKDSHKGLFDVVIVWKLDRFARNRYDSAHYKAILRKNGVKVVSATEAIATDSTGILLESLLEGYAEFYSAELAEKVVRGMTENALKCKYNGGSIPMGYVIDKDQHFQVDPTTAPVILEIFKLYSEGTSMQKLVNMLNKRGIKSSRGGKITLNIVNHILKNRRYIGEYSYRDIVQSDAIPAIVPKDLFDRVQERIAKNKKAPARHKAEDDYLLTTKLYCGKCGAFMVGESGTSHTMKVHHYYRCVNTKKKKLCDKKAVKKEWIENLVIDQTMKVIMDDAMVLYIADMVLDLQARESTDLPLLKQQLAETEKAIKNILDAIQQGIFNSSTKMRLDELEDNKSKLEVSILQEEMQKPLLTKEQVTFWICRFRDVDVTNQEQRQRLIDSFVNSVYLYDDRLIITFNYKDGAKTVSLADIEGSDLTRFGAPRRRKRHIACGDFSTEVAVCSFCCGSFFAKSLARFACSVVNALTTALCRYQLFAILCASRT